MIDYIIFSVIWLVVSLFFLGMSRFEDNRLTVQWWSRAVLATPVWPLALAYAVYRLFKFVWKKANLIEMLEP